MSRLSTLAFLAATETACVHQPELIQKPAPQAQMVVDPIKTGEVADQILALIQNCDPTAQRVFPTAWAMAATPSLPQGVGYNPEAVQEACMDTALGASMRVTLAPGQNCKFMWMPNPGSTYNQVGVQCYQFPEN